MAKYYNSRPLSVIQQLIKIKKDYDNIAHTCIKKDCLDVTLVIRPTENSDKYTVRILYKYDTFPYIYLLDPPLVQVNGKYPHHIYERTNEKTRLCVYYPRSREWTSDMFIADTIIPWISTWLFAYEFWQITGVWHYDESNHLNKG